MGGSMEWILLVIISYLIQLQYFRGNKNAYNDNAHKMYNTFISCKISPVTLDYKTLLLLLVKKDNEEYKLGGKGVGVEFCVFWDAIRVWINIIPMITNERTIIALLQCFSATLGYIFWQYKWKLISPGLHFPHGSTKWGMHQL